MRNKSNCTVCNKSFIKKIHNQKTCTPECRAKYRSMCDKIKNKAVSEKRRTDTEYRNMLLAKEKIRAEKKKKILQNDPELKSKYLARIREIWHSGKRERLLPKRRLKQALNREEVNKKNREYYKNLTKDKKSLIINRSREWLEKLRDDQELYSDFKAIQNEKASIKRLESQALKLKLKLHEKLTKK